MPNQDHHRVQEASTWRRSRVMHGRSTLFIPSGWHHEQRCVRCGAVVDYRDIELHTQFHKRIDELFETLEKALGMREETQEVGDDIVSRARAEGIAEVPAGNAREERE